MKKFQCLFFFCIFSFVFGLSISPSISCIEFQEYILSITQDDLYILNANNDTTPPVTNISLHGNMSEYGIFTDDVEVTLNATDDLSGVNVTYYRLDSGDLIIYSEPFIVTGHGKHILAYWSKDNAGNNEKTNFMYITIDLIPPEINLLWYILEGSIKFDPVVSETGSGIERVEYYINNKHMYTAYGENSTWIWIPDINGYHLVSVIVFDKAGHSNNSNKNINFPIFNISIIGIISKLKIYPDVITFNALIIFTDKYGPIFFRHISLSKFYDGYLGNFFINAKFT